MGRSTLIAVLGWMTACQGQGADSPTPLESPREWPGAHPGSPKVTKVSNLFATSPRRAAPGQEPAAPWSLTASDGSGLVLTRVDARAIVEGPLAFTELHLHFHNPEPRLREGTFAITLPTGAAVARFAMEIDGALVEAEVVENQLARRAYENSLHRRQDPALLERAAGNQFSARVFPILPNADKHLVISFAQEVMPGHYELPLRGLAKSHRVDVRVQVRGADGALSEQTLTEHDWRPDRDVIVDGSSTDAPPAIAAGDLVATRLAIELPDAPAPPTSVTLAVDTSASRALGFAAEAHRIHALVDELARVHGGALPIQVVAFDQDTTEIYDGRADGSASLEAALVDRGALGASDLGQALTWLGDHAPRERIVLVTDGVITAGADLDRLRAIVNRLGRSGVDRIDVVLTGGIRDGQAAAAIARAGLPHAGAVLDLDRGAAEVARRIGLAVHAELSVTAEGARWLFPRTVPAAQSGDQVTIYLRRDPRADRLAITIAGATTKLSPVGVAPALIGRAVAASEITELEGQLAKATGERATTLRAEIVRRSVAARVVSSQTSMLVLESDADHARFGIDRRVVAQILELGPRGVELAPRVAIARPVQPGPGRDRRPRPAPADDRAVLHDDSPTAMAHDEGTSGWPDPDRADGAAQGDRAVVHDTAAQTDTDRAAAAETEADRAIPAVAAAETRADHAAATSELQRARAELQRLQVRAAAARAARPHRIQIDPACLDNPLCDAPSPSRSRDAASNVDWHDDHRTEPALRGRLAEIATALARGQVDTALARAAVWHREEPGDVLALIGLGEALEAKHEVATAARVYGSIIDLYPARADLRRFAGERLERLGPAQRALIIDTYERAVADRPDHLTGHRLLAYALLRDGQFAAAFAAILAGIDQHYPDARFAGAARVLAEDAGMIGAAYVAIVPGQRDEVIAALARRDAKLATAPSTRFVLYWETDANDVDLHIRDARGGSAWYAKPVLASGGELYADITTGYGPECFAIPSPVRAAPYRLSIHYYAQGPMGYGMGLLQIQRFDGRGTLTFDDRPYVVMTDGAFVDLGWYR